ncbi:MAG: hypothetical protein KAR33_02705 [Candidatus Thorarchaeota archaeon]|nr:hypothetical protein [Candidatus Thorarchaeota archaeon]
MQVEMTNETTAIVTYPIVGAVKQMEEFLKEKAAVKNWEEANEFQQFFMKEFYSICKNEIDTIPEIESIAHIDASVINDWLKHHGFDIELNPFGPGGFGTASKLDLSGYWERTGSQTTIYLGSEESYPAVKMLAGYALFKYQENEDLVVKVRTEGNDDVYLMMVDKVPSGLAMVDYVSQIQSEMERAYIEYEGLIFPMIDLDVQGPLGWIVGLKAHVESGQIPFYEIAQALQQTKLKMNHKGFRIKSAVAMGILAGAPLKKKEPYIIDRPFVMWVSRPTLKKLLFVGYFNKDVWKDPEGLEM